MNARLQPLLVQLGRELKKIYGPRLVGSFLYGSSARGDQDPGSDIDVAVVLRGPVNPGEEIARSGGVVASLSLENNRVLSCLFLSEERFRRERSPLLLNLRREGVAI